MSSWILKACDFCGLVHEPKARRGKGWSLRLHGDGAKAGAFAYSIKCLRVELKVEEKGEIKAHSGTNFGKYIARDLLPNVLP
jgi:hypothetical protein